MGKYSFIFIGYIVISASVLLFSIISALPQTPISADSSTGKIISQYMPQGWGFFSKNPRDSMLNAIEVSTNEGLRWPNSSPSNYFGLKRFGRGQGIELGRITSQLTTTDYNTCEPLNEACLENVKEFKAVVNDDQNASICGKWIIYHVDPVPWAWGYKYKEIDMDAEVIGVDIACSVT